LRVQASAVAVMHVSTLAMYLEVLDRIEELFPCRHEHRLKTALMHTKLQLLMLEPSDLRAVWQEFC